VKKLLGICKINLKPGYQLVSLQVECDKTDFVTW